VLLHALVEKENDNEQMEAALQAHGIAARIERVLPSLEDVFIYLTDQEN